LRHTFVPRIRYLGFTTRGKKGPLTTTGDLYACESQTNFDTIINRQHPRARPLPVREFDHGSKSVPVRARRISTGYRAYAGEHLRTTASHRRLLGPARSTRASRGKVLGVGVGCGRRGARAGVDSQKGGRGPRRAAVKELTPASVVSELGERGRRCKVRKRSSGRGGLHLSHRRSSCHHAGPLTFPRTAPSGPRAPTAGKGRTKGAEVEPPRMEGGEEAPDPPDV
jgi:hypothetical protein